MTTINRADHLAESAPYILSVLRFLDDNLGTLDRWALTHYGDVDVASHDPLDVVVAMAEYVGHVFTVEARNDRDETLGWIAFDTTDTLDGVIRDHSPALTDLIDEWAAPYDGKVDFRQYLARTRVF
jgi:hypothetical protein